jgi:hypothetical protein
LPATDVETAGGLREMAERARRWAMMVPPGDEGAKRLLAFARELDARADALEVIEVKPPGANQEDALPGSMPEEQQPEAVPITCVSR